MKILAIRGENLASLDDKFELDFTKDPLKGAGIFAITGVTGSGKSTLLDALCLALYDSTPRLYKAKENGVALVDVNGKTINQNDTRSILRRGTAEGIAEVDFLSTTSEEYRSRWIVRRSRGKVDGSLKLVEMQLINLTTGREERGTKSEILKRIEQLVGLSFEQFNRSVLLAQGDFAMFLKAKQSDKAEILEKLTGGKIYSEVSSIIYNKAKIVISEYKELKDKIDNMALLTDEEIDQLKDETKSVKESLDKLNDELEKNLLSQKWINDKYVLQKKRDESFQKYQLSKKSVEEASSRFDRMSDIDRVQPIRDLYFRLSGNKSRLSEDKNLLLSYQTSCKIITDEVASCKAKLKEDEKLKSECEEKNNLLAPQIKKARELDIRINEKKRQIETLKGENKRELKSKNEVLLKITKKEAEQKLCNDKLDEIAKWFDEYKKYEQLIPIVDLVVKLIDNLDKEKDYLKNNSKSLDDKKIKKERKEKQLQEKKEEEERLNKLLPSEVVKLRKELVEGEPCPVCGSIHHSLTVIEDLSSLNDEELSNSKEKNAKDIEIITKELEDIKNEIISITAKVQNSKENILSDKENIARYVKDITSWEELLDNQKLKGALIKLRSLWQEKQNSEKENKEIIVNLNLKLEGFKSEIKSYDQQIREKSEKIGDIEKELNSEIVERNQLLGGKQTEDVENEMEKVVNESNEKVEKARATYHSLQIKLSADKTKISQLEEQIKKTVIEIHADETSLNEWLSLAKPAIKNDYFVELMNYDMSKVEAERKVLSQLTQDLENSNSILKEKEKDIIEHESSANRPSIDDNIESLISRQNEIKELIHTANSRRAEIKIRLENNDKEKSSRESLLKELEKKRVPYENWQALNILFGSQTGDKFKEIAQGYTLDFLLLYANKHLKDLAPRYELQRISDTLALQVIDVDMMGESRSVHSLSGGESFLVSLALALGLSSLSSNRMNVESLFIDEGFGSLDIDTLRVAMEALERLQMQGRKIGVISHVEEMTERIAVQIQVKKEGNGRSIVLIK